MGDVALDQMILIDHASFSSPGGCSTSFLEIAQEAALLTDALLAPVATLVSSANLPEHVQNKQLEPGKRHITLKNLRCNVL